MAVNQYGLPTTLTSAPGAFYQTPQIDYGDFAQPADQQLALQRAMMGDPSTWAPYVKWSDDPNMRGWRTSDELMGADPGFYRSDQLSLMGVGPNGEYLVKRKTGDKEGTIFAYTPQAGGGYSLSDPLRTEHWDTNTGLLEDPKVLAMLAGVGLVGAGAAGAFGGLGGSGAGSSGLLEGMGMGAAPGEAVGSFTGSALPAAGAGIAADAGAGMLAPVSEGATGVAAGAGGAAGGLGSSLGSALGSVPKFIADNADWLKYAIPALGGLGGYLDAKSQEGKSTGDPWATEAARQHVGAMPPVPQFSMGLMGAPTFSTGLMGTPTFSTQLRSPWGRY